MANPKKRELKNMSMDQLRGKLEELKKELMKLNAQIAVGINPKNPSQAKSLKKTIARIHTFAQEKNKKGGEKKKIKGNE